MWYPVCQKPVPLIQNVAKSGIILEKMTMLTAKQKLRVHNIMSFGKDISQSSVTPVLTMPMNKHSCWITLLLPFLIL